MGLVGLSVFAWSHGFAQSAPGLQQAVLDTPFVLKMGETAALKGTPLRVTFEDVPEDSRCPAHVRCIWQGNAEVRLSLTSGKGSAPLVLNTVDRLDMPSAALIPGFPYRLKLETLESEPRDPQNKNSPKTHKAHLLFTRV
jgi:hypothetical protein